MKMFSSSVLTAVLLIGLLPVAGKADSITELRTAVTQLEKKLERLIQRESKTRQAQFDSLQQLLAQGAEATVAGTESQRYQYLRKRVEQLALVVDRLSATESPAAGVPPANEANLAIVTRAEYDDLLAELTTLRAEQGALREQLKGNNEQLASLEEYFPTEKTTTDAATEKRFIPRLNLTGFVDASNYSDVTAQESEFGLDQVEVDLAHAISRAARAQADIEYLNDGNGGFDLALEQGFVSFRMGAKEQWEFTFGKFNAPIGFESPDPVDMYQYSYGNLFTYATPTNLTGIHLSYALSQDVSLGFLLVNGWDVNADNNGDKTFGFRFQYAPSENVTIRTTALSGPELANNVSSRRSVVNLDLSYQLTPFWKMGGDANFGTETKFASSGADASWYGAMIMSNWSFGGRYGFTLRCDHLNDDDASRTGFGQQLTSLTVSPSMSIVTGLTGLFELRYDQSSANFFVDENGAAVDSRVGAAVEFTYGF